MKIISLLLAVLLSFSFLVGCDTEQPTIDNPTTKEPNTSIDTPTGETKEDVTQESDNKVNIGFNNFDTDLLNFINNTYSTKNYMISPLSYRYAMALATSGANGETQEELIKSMSFETMDDYLEWTNTINTIVADFDEELKYDIQQAKQFGFTDALPSRALKVTNSIWHNTDKLGTIKDSYINYASEHFGAIAQNVPQDELVSTVNDWVNENTNSMIPSILTKSAENSNTILVNTIYMKSAWINAFNKSATKKGEFTTINGNKTEKEFMFQQTSYRYYEDNDSKVVILPMDGGINVAIVLGNNENISEKLNDTKKTEVILQLPKFEVETSFDKGELIDYLIYKNVDLALRQEEGADFSTMIEDAKIHIDNIIQKTKITLDEYGTEAAAATAITMLENTAVREPKEPKQFIANEPFTYYIYANSNNGPELLFFGQIVE